MSFKIRNQLVPDVHDTITIGVGSGIATKTHANKIFANCRLRYLSYRDNSDGSGTFPYIYLTQSGSDVIVNAIRSGVASSINVIAYAIEEYINHIIKSNQRFLIQDPGLGIAINHTVTQIGIYYSLDQLGVNTTDNVGGNSGAWGMTGAYDGVTTVVGTPTINGGASTITASFELVEWY